MPVDKISDFRFGIDARKFYLSSPAGSLTSLINAHITEGGEIEKRKAFVNVPVPAPYTSVTFGLQPSSDGIYLFGSYTIQAPALERSRTSNVATLYLPRNSVAAQAILGHTPNINVTNAGGVGYNLSNVAVISTVDDGVTYISLTYASVGPDEALTFDLNARVIRVSDVITAPFLYQSIIHPAFRASGAGSLSPVCTGIVSSTLFGDLPFVLAKFSDGSVFPYYNGECLTDSFEGLEFLGSDASANTLLTALVDYMNGSTTTYTAQMTGSGIADIFSIPTTLNGTPYTAQVTFNSINGTAVAAQQTTGQAATAATQAVGSFQIVSADAGTQATGTISNTSDSNMNDGDTFTIGSITYRFKNTMAAAYDVKIQSTRGGTLTSFAAAINGSGTVGTDYFAGTLANTSAQCTALNTSTGHFTLFIAALAGGTGGNSIAFTSTASTRLVASASTLLGAIDSKVNQIVIHSVTNLLTAAVAFTTDEPTTAAAIVAAINSNVASGYQAISNGTTVTIMAQVAGATPNTFSLQVQSQGTIVTGTGAFSLTGSGFTLDYVKVNGVDLMNDTALLANETVMTYPQVPGQVLADFCRAVANNINSQSATLGYIANCKRGSVSTYLAKGTLTSTDATQVLDVSVTAAVGQSGAALPVTVNPLSVTLDSNAVAIPVSGKSDVVTATVNGGVSPFIYKWTQSGSNVSGIKATNPSQPQTAFASALNISLQNQLQTYKSLQGQQRINYLNSHPALQAFLNSIQTNQVAFVCTVTDALGQVAVSESVYVTLLGTA